MPNRTSCILLVFSGVFSTALKVADGQSISVGQTRKELDSGVRGLTAQRLTKFSRIETKMTCVSVIRINDLHAVLGKEAGLFGKHEPRVEFDWAAHKIATTVKNAGNFGSKEVAWDEDLVVTPGGSAHQDALEVRRVALCVLGT
jgi:hypothetical protein